MIYRRRYVQGTHEVLLHNRVRENDQRKDNQHFNATRDKSITRMKDEVETKTKIPKALQHLSNQGGNTE